MMLKNLVILLIVGSVSMIIFILSSNTVGAVDRHVGPGQPYAHIQDAINASNNGDNIYVHAGTYYEFVNVNKSIDLIGNSHTDTILRPPDNRDSSISIRVSNVNISNFSIIGLNDEYGIYISSNNNNITILYCNISSFKYGIFGFLNIEDVLVYYCNIEYNLQYGIRNGWGSNSDNWHILNTNFSYNTRGVMLQGIYAKVENCKFIGHTGANMHIPYPAIYVDIKDCYIEGGTYILANVARNLFIDNCTIYNSTHTGIKFSHSEHTEVNNSIIRYCPIGVNYTGCNWPASNHTVQNCTIKNNNIGISIEAEKQIYIHYNNVSDNNYTFYIIAECPMGDWTDDVLIYNNYFDPIISQGILLYDLSNNVTLNISKTNGTNIINGSYLGGNYWSDYTGLDADGDGIGDTPYILAIVNGTELRDFLPLIPPGGGSNITCNITADFTYEPKLIYPDTTVVFTDRSIGNVTNWYWNFGDGSTAIGKNQNHRYQKSGTYRVVLTVYTNDTSCNDSKALMLKVSERKEFGLIIPVDPLYPDNYYTVPQMYQLLKVESLSRSDATLKIIFIDTGYTPRVYNNVDLSKTKGLGDPTYDDKIDDHGHGTWINYAISYITNLKIPNAEVISYKVFDETGSCTNQQILDAFETIMRLNPDIVSFSGGCLGNPNDVFSKKVDELRKSGIVVVVAAGNMGPSASTVLSPACSEGALAIAASDPMFTILNVADDIICDWSSRGPVLGVYPKPDYTSPGESIIGPWLNTERVVSGTSMSTPLIAGGISVAYADNKWIVDFADLLYFWDGATVPSIIEDAMDENTFRKYPVDSYGWGIPDFESISSSIFWKALILIIIWFLVLIIIIIAIIFIIRWFHKDSVKNKG